MTRAKLHKLGDGRSLSWVSPSGGEASRYGLGLGLFIAKELVTWQGGRIWVESVWIAAAPFLHPAAALSSQTLPDFFPEPNFESGVVTLISVELTSRGGGDQGHLHLR